MSTRTLVDCIYSRINKLPLKNEWTRNTGSLSILKLIERGQDELLEEAKKYQIWIGTENGGFPPYLKTVKGQHRYEITAANLSEVTAITVDVAGSPVVVKPKLVLKVFVDATHGCDDYGISQYNQSVPYHFHNPLSGNMNRLEILPVPVKAYEALESGNAYLDFLIDPGDTTKKYFCEFTWTAPRLTSESIPLVIPQRFESALEDYAVGCVLEYEQPVPSAYKQKFETFWKPQFRDSKSAGAQPAGTQVIRRLC